MKFAVPVLNGVLCPHFGHCERFSIIETDESGKIISSTLQTPPPHEPGVLPEWLGNMGVTHVIAGGMGIRAQDLFKSKGISVTVGAPMLESEKLVDTYIKGELISGENICDH